MGGRMTEDDIIFDIAISETVNNENGYVPNTHSQELNEAEISGKINLFLRYMMDTPIAKREDYYFTAQMIYMAQQYEKGYRHSYYNISAEIYTYWGKNEEKLTNLVNNVEYIKSFVKVDTKLFQTEAVIKGFRKLYDHVMLEIVRLNDYQKNINELNSVIEEFKEKSQKTFNQHSMSLDQTAAEFSNKYIETSQKLDQTVEEINGKYFKTAEELDKVEKDAKKIKKKVKSAYSQFVSILGIFAAVIIVFFGGASVFSSVLTNIHEAEWYQIGFGVAFVGLAMFDIVFMFLYILSKLLDTPISTKENSEKKYYIWRCFDKYPYLFWFNAICLMIMAICA